MRRLRNSGEDETEKPALSIDRSIAHLCSTIFSFNLVTFLAKTLVVDFASGSLHSDQRQSTRFQLESHVQPTLLIGPPEFFQEMQHLLIVLEASTLYEHGAKAPYGLLTINAFSSYCPKNEHWPWQVVQEAFNIMQSLQSQD